MAEQLLLGLFSDPGHTADFIDEIRKLGVSEDRITVMSGMPYSGAMLGRERFHARVARASLTGAFLGILLAAFLTAGIFLLYPLFQGGQPLIPIPTSLIIYFEVAMLGTMWGAFFGMIFLNRFPIFTPQIYDPHITEGMIGVQVEVDNGDLAKSAADIFKSFNASHFQQTDAAPRFDRGFWIFWTAVAGVLLVGATISALFFYNIFQIPFPTNMADQDSIGFEQGPRLAAPTEAIPIQGPVLIAGQPASQPLPATKDSLQRGQVLFNINCVMCHGPQGLGNGPVGGFFTPKPFDLSSAKVQNLTDDQIYLVLSNGLGVMPSMAENLDATERWDVVNFVRTLKK